MPIATSNKNNKTDIVVVKKVKNYNNEPVFKKKAEKAKAILNKHGLPDSFRKKS